MAARSTSDTTLHDVALVGDDAAMTLTDKSTWRNRVGFVSNPEEMARERLCFGDDKKAVASDRAEQREEHGRADTPDEASEGNIRSQTEGD